MDNLTSFSSATGIAAALACAVCASGSIFDITPSEYHHLVHQKPVYNYQDDYGLTQVGYRIIQDEYVQLFEKATIIQNFARKLLNDSIELDPKIIQAVNDNIRDLLA